MRRCRLVPLLVLALGWNLRAGAFDINPKGHDLARFFDSLDVERHWLSGEHVNWRTGDPDTGRRGATHCSAFVASACERLGVYILRPPQHGQELLANAQYEWLHSQGAEHGWKPVRTPFEAQRLANEGFLVVATCRNPNSNKPGHIALVRPSRKADQLIERDGPEIIQAGTVNHRSTSLKSGFKNHPEAWIDGSHRSVRFYVHEAARLAGSRAPSADGSFPATAVE